VAAAPGSGSTWLDRLLRAGRASDRDVLLDLLALIVLALLLMATGLGLRDPWPADEPHFALVAQDMLRSGEIRRIVERYGVPFYPPVDDAAAPGMNAELGRKPAAN